VRAEVAARPELNERYGLGSNMGYGTAAHIAGLKTWGADVLHRRSFAPVREVTGSALPPRKAPASGPLFTNRRIAGKGKSGGDGVIAHVE
jgi:hypothetical protein